VFQPVLMQIYGI